MPEASGRIVVLGDVIDDVIAVPRGPIRMDTDTPSTIERRPGGSAANVAAWLGWLGGDVDFVGNVAAADVERHSALLAANGVTPHLEGHPSLSTGTIVVVVEGERRSFLTDRGANESLDPARVDNALLSRAGIVHFTGYSLFGRPDDSSIVDLIGRAAVAGVRVTVDPGSAGFLADYGPERFLRVVAGASIVLPSLDEGRVLTGMDDPVQVARRLAESFPLAVVTLGTDGAVVARAGSEPVRVPAVPAAVVDPTGAGDAFAAGFLDSWLRLDDPVAAAEAGARTAARAVGVMGGRPR